MGRWITGELVVATLFLIAWLFPLVVIGGYRLRVVGVRWREIEKTYFDGGLAPAQFQTRYELKDHPAAHFLPAKSELNDDNDDEDERLRTAVLAEFDRIQAWERYFVPLTLLVTVSALGFWLCHAWVHERWFEVPPAGPAIFPATMSLSVVMALVGAYVWGVWELMERVRERNLTPSEIWEVCFRWFVAVPVGYAFSLIGFEEAKPAFAFAASAFPLKSLHRYIRESDLKKLGLEPERATAAQQRIHTSIEGVSDVMATRLEELAIYTVLDMAYANPIKIMVNRDAVLDRCS